MFTTTAFTASAVAGVARTSQNCFENAIGVIIKDGSVRFSERQREGR